MHVLFQNSELKITLLLVNIIVNTECHHSQNNTAGQYNNFHTQSSGY